MQGSQFYFSSILGNMGKTKADFELSPRSVETYYFKVGMNQRREVILSFPEAVFSSTLPNIRSWKKGFMTSKVTQPEAGVRSNVFFIITTDPPASQHVNLAANPLAGCDKQFNSFNKCKDINITKGLKSLIMAQRSKVSQWNSENNASFMS